MKEMNKLGFTLIEIMVSLVVVIVAMQIFLALMVVYNRPADNQHISDKEVLLIKQLERDLILCQKISNLNPFTCITYIGEEISYEIINSKLVRRINGLGYEVIYPKLDNYYVEKTATITWYITIENITHELLVGLFNE